MVDLRENTIERNIFYPLIPFRHAVAAQLRFCAVVNGLRVYIQGVPRFYATSIIRAYPV